MICQDDISFMQCLCVRYALNMTEFRFIYRGPAVLSAKIILYDNRVFDINYAICESLLSTHHESVFWFGVNRWLYSSWQ